MERNNTKEMRLTRRIIKLLGKIQMERDWLSEIRWKGIGEVKTNKRHKFIGTYIADT